MNPILTFPIESESRKYRRSPPDTLLGFPPVGRFTPQNIPKMIFDFDGKSACSAGNNNLSQGITITQLQSRVGSLALIQAAGVLGARYVNSRLHQGFPVIYSDGNANEAMSGVIPDQSYDSRNFSFFMFARRRKVWSATGTDPTPLGSYICTFTGPTPLDYYLQYSTSNGNQWKQHLLDNGTARHSGATAGMVMAHTFDLMGFVVDIKGNITFYENNRAMPGSSAVTLERKTGFTLTRTSSGWSEWELAGFAAWQYALNDADVARLGQYWRAKIGQPADGPTTSLTLTGDSITAGETYVDSNNRLLPTICERLAIKEPRLRIGDMTRSATTIANGVIWMLTDGTAGQAGGNAIHSSYFGTQIHVICHGRNDLNRGDSVATVLASMQTAITQQTGLGRLVFAAKVIATATTFTTSVPIATTANITLSGEQTIDGVLTSASRVLVKDQTDQTQNGIYISAAGAWARSSDANTGALVLALRTQVTSGTANTGTCWRCSNATAPTLGVTNITFAQMSFATQAQFDQNCIDFNNGLAGLTGVTAVVPLGDDPAFAVSVGGTVYTDATYYAGDNLHPNGTQGADRMTEILRAALKPYIR